MGSNYAKGVYDQLMDVMARLDTMEAAHVQDRKEIRMLTSEVGSLRKENTRLREEVSGLRQENAALKEEGAALRKENGLLREDNERMKRILDNDSTNSSLPPSSDQPGKAPNTYNGRKPTKKSPGAQPGHKGNGLSKAEVLRKIQAGVYGHRIEEIGVTDRPYITRYRLDLDVRTVATEIRIHADDDGKFQVPGDLRADVSYGGTVRAIVAFLYSEGVVANDRICMFINSLSGDGMHIFTRSATSI